MEQVITYKEKGSLSSGVIFAVVAILFILGLATISVISGKIHNVLLFQISGVFYLAAAVFYIIAVFLKGDKLSKIATLTAFLAWSIQSAALFVRGIEAYQLGIFHPPWTNLYESLMFFPWLATTLYLYIERQYKVKAIGAFFFPIVAFLIIWAHQFNTEIDPLVPALRSYWLYIHVLASFAGYAGFTVAFGASVAFLIKNNYDKNIRVNIKHIAGFILSLILLIPFGYWTLTGAKDLKTMVMGVIFIMLLLTFIYFATYVLKPVGKFLPSKTILSEIALKAVALSFPIWTASIILGGAWANEAWGSYWSWDPKENWALIVWLFFAAYIHGRTIGKWKDTTASWIVVAGFIMLLICYFGVNLYFPGLHSYATE